jgi:ABC-type uncharacterized transport system substrate-binding protein
LLGGADIITRDTSGHIFQQAYNARFATFSNRRAWVEEGALFGGEPDFEHHGVQLARVMLRAIQSRGTEPELTEKISTVLNVRVARGLGIEVTDEIRRQAGVLVNDD